MKPNMQANVTGDVWMQIRDPGLLRQLARAHGMTMRDVSAAVWPQASSKSTGTVARMYSGQIKTITPERAARWAALFGVGLDVLFVPRVSNRPGLSVPRSGQERKAS